MSSWRGAIIPKSALVKNLWSPRYIELDNNKSGGPVSDLKVSL